MHIPSPLNTTKPKPLPISVSRQEPRRGAQAKKEMNEMKNLVVVVLEAVQIVKKCRKSLEIKGFQLRHLQNVVVEAFENMFAKCG